VYREDTIAAISTSLGEGGIGIIRVSGPDAPAMANQLIRLSGSGGLQSHRFSYGVLIDPATGETVDEVMVVLMRAPRSYTREDLLEIQCHGGSLLVQRVLGVVLRQGARLGEPGEFTKRAFLNGRIDLVQAEAVIDLIRGKTEAAITLAQHQREGMLSRKLDEIRSRLVTSLAFIEAHIDFPEEDIEPTALERIRESTAAGLHEVSDLIDGFSAGRVLRDGVSVLIAGKPNVGKSSLLNTLLKEKRSIVTAIPGTTRDLIEEIVNIKGLPVRLMDTAGIRDTTDPVEEEGVRRARERLAVADLTLFVLDGSRPFDEDDRLILGDLAGRPYFVVRNKMDLPHCLALPELMEPLADLRISTLTGEGVDGLLEAIHQTFLKGEAIDSREYVTLSRARHRDALELCRDRLLQFQENAETGAELELLAVDLRDALSALGSVTGETTPDEVLDLIFSSFCIGK
jgi:tRNA modification GTPase